VDQASRDPLRGRLYENFVILEILKSHYDRGKRPQLYFYRDTHGNAVDLVLKRQRRLIPIEIKSAVTFTKDFLKEIDRFIKITKDRCNAGYVIYNGEYTFQINHVSVQNILNHGMISLS